MIRTHLTWSGKACDLPRFTEVYAHTAGALGLRLKRELSDVAIHTETLAHRGGRLPQSRPAADRGVR